MTPWCGGGQGVAPPAIGLRSLIHILVNRGHSSSLSCRMAQALIEMELDEDIRKLEAAGPDEDYVAPEGMLMYTTLMRLP